MSRTGNQLSLLPGAEADPMDTAPTPGAVARAFDAARLTQARHLAGKTKKDVAAAVGVTAAAVGQYESGVTKPRPDLIPRLAEELRVPITFFVSGRPHARLDASGAHFRSLRSARAWQRDRAIAHVKQVWELTLALEKRVQLPPVDLPGFAGGEVHSGVELPRSPVEAARALRVYWRLGTGPIPHLVRHLEARGIVVDAPPANHADREVDAFSIAYLRPIMVLTANRTDDVYRYRFTAAHELGHLVLHGDTAPGDTQHEREADAFAAEFLTPRDSVLPDLPARVDLSRLVELQQVWGVSVDSLLYRCREVGLLSDQAAGRAWRRLAGLRHQPGFVAESVSRYPGEQPVMLRQAFELAATETGLTVPTLAHELGWAVPRVRELLGLTHQRPVLRLVP
ncbi:ImmA/IrrE family metallo-endopeptidase [Micromonospora sp. NPDC048930]|uniref:ImmA/IrrE family metallo-endopeptidase n=1 Tax=Micromonospora sp. NPDC048930 TaxID=3364261 RepID=UPI003720783A